MARIPTWLVLLVSFTGCSGPPLEPWHTERLREEFAANQAGRVRSFEDYRQLEDRLYAELEEKVYLPTPTGPEQALVRFSAGSVADPRNDAPDWNRSFEWGAESAVGGVLLLHGMSDSPYALRALAEALHREGYHVLGLRMPGHGTAPSGLKYIRAEDMIAATRLGMAHLSSSLGDRPIHMIGYSTGAALALDFALDAKDGKAAPRPASLVLISPAIRIHAAAALASFKDGLSVVPGLGRLAWLQILPEFDPYKYNSFATNAGDVVHRLTLSVDTRLSRSRGSNDESVFPPVLVLKSTVDSTVTTSAVVDNLLGVLPPDRHELVLFDINRFAAKTILLSRDPAPLTDRLIADDSLPFAVTFVENEAPDSTRVVARTKAPFSAEVKTTPLGLRWPPGVASLSHVALPIAPDDPLYGRRPPGNDDVLWLGELAMQGERGLLKLSGEWMLRMRYNPFYDLLEQRVLDWLSRAN